MKAENGIRRPQDNVLTHPPAMTTASCFHFMASESGAEHVRLGLSLFPAAEPGRGVVDSEPQLLRLLGRGAGMPHFLI